MNLSPTLPPWARPPPLIPTPPPWAQAAERALALSPICPEAYNLLALYRAASLDEALELYRKAVQVGPLVRVAGRAGRLGSSRGSCLVAAS